MSVVVPVYFNAEALPELFDRLCAVEAELAARGLALELIFVDDGSKDASQAELLKIRERRPATTVIELTRNFGVNAALRTGLRFVTGDCFAFLAADLQDPPHLVVDMVDRWLEGSKFVICERVTRDDPPMSRWLSRVYYFTLRKLVLPGYPAGGFDLALMDRSMLAPLRDSGKSAFLPLLAYWLGFEPSVLPLPARKPAARTLAVDAAKEAAGFFRRPVRLLRDADTRHIGGRRGGLPGQFRLRRGGGRGRADRQRAGPGLLDDRGARDLPARAHHPHARRDRRVPVARIRRHERPAGRRGQGSPRKEYP